MAHQASPAPHNAHVLSPQQCNHSVAHRGRAHGARSCGGALADGAHAARAMATPLAKGCPTWHTCTPRLCNFIACRLAMPGCTTQSPGRHATDPQTDGCGMGWQPPRTSRERARQQAMANGPAAADIQARNLNHYKKDLTSLPAAALFVQGRMRLSLPLKLRYGGAELQPCISPLGHMTHAALHGGAAAAIYQLPSEYKCKNDSESTGLHRRASGTLRLLTAPAPLPLAPPLAVARGSCRRPPRCCCWVRMGRGRAAAGTSSLLPPACRTRCTALAPWSSPPAASKREGGSPTE